MLLQPSDFLTALLAVWIKLVTDKPKDPMYSFRRFLETILFSQCDRRNTIDLIDPNNTRKSLNLRSKVA